MNIYDFEKVERISYEKDLSREDLVYYDIAQFKQEFFVTKYNEYDYSVPLADPNGKFVELGVFKGRSIKYLAKTWPDIHWYGFDTFEGIDEKWDMGQKVVDMNTFKTPIPNVPNNVTFIKGLFEDTLINWAEENLKDSFLSYINMDADVYGATKYGLMALNKWIRDGTIIRFDELSDWRLMGFETSSDIVNMLPHTRYTTWREGEWKALNEWMKECDREVRPLWRNWHQSAGIEVVK